MRIRAVSVFEGVVYHCWPVDLSNPTRPQLEVDALLRPGDADATAGPLLLSVADYIAMVGDLEVARRGLHDLDRAGRIVQHLTADHIAFPTWTRVTDGDGPDPDGPAAADPDGADEPDVDAPATGHGDGAAGGEAADTPPPTLRLVADRPDLES
jgi:hypothetical protein